VCSTCEGVAPVVARVDGGAERGLAAVVGGEEARGEARGGGGAV
jgi:hypothetical protein